MIEADAAALAQTIRLDFPHPVSAGDGNWPTPAARVIDCVLSLRKPYTKVVEPRVKCFVESHPDVRTCADLLAHLRAFHAPEAFLATELKMNSPRKAKMLVGVLDYLIDIQSRFDAPTEEERLQLWAQWARPGDYLTLSVPGFKLAGFQYLRMLFGAQTVKPDVHLLRYAEDALGRPIAGRSEREVQVVYAFERAGELLDRPVTQIDAAIWRRGSSQDG